jgi:hypothetical protein
VGSAALPDALEKHASYVAKESVSSVLQPIYKTTNFSMGTNWTGRYRLPFGEGNRARWAGNSFLAIPSYFPTTKSLTLSASTPQTVGTQSHKWRVTISNSGAVVSSPITGTDGSIPPQLVLRMDRTTGVFSGQYSYGSAWRMLYGVAIDSSTSSTKRAGQGWVELGTAPSVKTGTWTLSE